MEPERESPKSGCGTSEHQAMEREKQRMMHQLLQNQERKLNSDCWEKDTPEVPYSPAERGSSHAHNFLGTVKQSESKTHSFPQMPHSKGNNVCKEKEFMTFCKTPTFKYNRTVTDEKPGFKGAGSVQTEQQITLNGLEEFNANNRNRSASSNKRTRMDLLCKQYNRRWKTQMEKGLGSSNSVEECKLSSKETRAGKRGKNRKQDLKDSIISMRDWKSKTHKELDPSVLKEKDKHFLYKEMQSCKRHSELGKNRMDYLKSSINSRRDCIRWKKQDPDADHLSVSCGVQDQPSMFESDQQISAQEHCEMEGESGNTCEDAKQCEKAPRTSVSPKKPD